MAKDAVLQIRIDSELKEKDAWASAVGEKHGLRGFCKMSFVKIGFGFAR